MSRSFAAISHTPSHDHAITPSLRVAGFEDSLSAIAHALWCHPLKVGLASEARSTTKPLATAEGRGRTAV